MCSQLLCIFHHDQLMWITCGYLYELCPISDDNLIKLWSIASRGWFSQTLTISHQIQKFWWSSYIGDTSIKNLVTKIDQIYIYSSFDFFFSSQPCRKSNTSEYDVFVCSFCLSAIRHSFWSLIGAIHLQHDILRFNCNILKILSITNSIPLFYKFISLVFRYCTIHVLMNSKIFFCFSVLLLGVSVEPFH